MNLFLLLTLLITPLFFLLINKLNKNPSKQQQQQPPSPPRLPIIGNLHQFASRSPHLRLHRLSKKHGPLISLKLGFTPTLIVSSPKLAKQVLKILDLSFCGRPPLSAFHKLSYNGSDIAFSPYGDSWRESRKVCVLHLFSSKKLRSSCSVREEEVLKMVHEISRLSDEGKVVDLSQMMMNLTISVTCRTAFGFGSTFCVENERSRSMRVLVRDAQGMFVGFFASDYFPYMGWVDRITGMSSRLQRVFLELDAFYEEIIEEHMKEERHVEELVDVLLRLQREKSLAFDLTTNHIKAILMNIFLAATETSASTVVWVMTELMRNPNAMKQVQEEARSKLMGNKTKDNNPIIKTQDFDKLVYLQSVIKESFRLHPIAPLLVPRQTTEDCTIQGYKIKAKTLVYVNAYSIGRDPETWENPDEFVPERFLGKEMDYKGQDFELIPFGSGRRMCPGMNMGMAMVEIAVVNLVCMFDWAVTEGMEDEILDMGTAPGLAVRKRVPLCLLAKNVDRN